MNETNIPLDDTWEPSKDRTDRNDRVWSIIAVLCVLLWVGDWMVYCQRAHSRSRARQRMSQTLRHLDPTTGETDLERTAKLSALPVTMPLYAGTLGVSAVDGLFAVFQLGARVCASAAFGFGWLVWLSSALSHREATDAFWASALRRAGILLGLATVSAWLLPPVAAFLFLVLLFCT